ncbi:hypothetical protein CK203_002523 [Vitis vinifera]|uniref:Reverse transcriptase zinc-binding domain-containing protein n=1 Tax=Vitis vinifera TaxID=29760 RepID=A0A438KHE9_VITVI|nr:hypothetical protein CK203_002523 [Vitis vinifera]
MHFSKEARLQVTNRILRYLKSALDNGILFKRNEGLILEVHTNVDWAGSVVDHMSTFGPFNDWEVEEVERLLLTIRGARLSPIMEDRMMWKVTSNESFSVKSLYNDLSSRRAGLFPHGLIWNLVCRPKCFMCCEEEESIDHILIHCSKARALWDLLFALFGVCWVLPYSARETLIEWRALCWARSIERCGRQPRCASFGRFGWKETGLLSIMRTFRFIG